MSEGQQLIFRIVTTTRGRPTGRFQSALAIPPLNRLDVHPEQVSHLMTG